MKLLYPTSIDLPSTRANRIQIVNMARAFSATLGDNFLLGLRKNAGEQLGFPSVEMPQARSFVLAWKYLLLARTQGITHVFCREERLLFFMMLYNRLWFRQPVKFFFELHHFWHTGWWYRLLLRHLDGIVVITQGLKNALVEKGHAEGRILVAPDAVSIAQFDIALSKADARRSLGLPEGFLAVYAGTIDEPWKGAGVLYEAGKLMDDAHKIVIVGGKPHYIDYFNAHHPPVQNVILVGHKPHADIPLYLKAADALVLPNSAKEEISRISTSPMKMFEYMASGRPIVASNLPSVREVLNESSAVLVSPDDPGALADGLRTLAKDPMLAERLGARARRDVERYTWDNRAKAVSDFISSHA